MTVGYKAFTPRLLKASSQGTARFVVATMNEVDHDQDVTLPGFFGRQAVAVLPAHDAGHVPLGKGVVYEVGGEAIAEVAFNMDIPAARDWHSAIRFDLDSPPPRMEYSYAYTVKQGGFRFGEFQGKRVRFLQPLPDGSPGADVHEVSPVLMGAGSRTYTLDAKDDDEAAGEYLRFVAIRHGVAGELEDTDDEAAGEYLRYATLLHTGGTR